MSAASALPTVLLQLIMHLLDQPALLRFGRCSRLTLAAASSPFAFRCLPPPIVCSLQPNLDQCLAASLIRFCTRIHLHWISPEEPDKPGPAAFEPAVPAEEHARFLATLPTIDALDALGRRDVDWSRQELRDALPHVRVLCMRQGDFGAVASLSSMLSLEDVTIACADNDVMLIGSLQVLPRLTALHLTQTTVRPMDVATAMMIGHCTRLRRLTLVRVHPWRLAHILSDGMQQLEELVLMHPSYHPASPEWYEPAGWYSCLRAPPKLQSISLLAVTSLSEHLRLLTLALHPGDPIRRLTLQRFDIPEHPDLVTYHLRHLFARLPQLERVDFELPSVVESADTTPRNEVVLRSRSTNFKQMSTENGRKFIKRELIALHELEAVDPRVHMIVPAVIQTAEERDAALRKRYRPTKSSGGCCIC